MYLLLCESACGGQRLPWGILLNHSPPFYVLRQDWSQNHKFTDWLGSLAGQYISGLCLSLSAPLTCCPVFDYTLHPPLLSFGHQNSGPCAHTGDSSWDWITFSSLQNGIIEAQRAQRGKDIWLFKCLSENTDLRSHLGFWFLGAVKRKCEEEGKRRGGGCTGRSIHGSCRVLAAMVLFCLVQNLQDWVWFSKMIIRPCVIIGPSNFFRLISSLWKMKWSKKSFGYA